METKGIAHKIDAKERTDDVRLKELAPFSKMLLSEPVRKGLHAAGFMYPTIIQATAIPVGKSGLDLLVQSKSGTGKTLIFSTVVLEFYDSKIREPQSLIVAPTREIAVQIAEILNEIGKYHAGFRAVCVIGGMDVSDDRKRLQGSKCVVGTPGRLLHLIQNEVLNTSQISILVLDEADKMCTQNFRQDLQRIVKALPKRQQTLACSATFNDSLDNELAKIMKNPLLISTQDRATLLVGIKQFVYELPEQKTSILEMEMKLEALRHIFGRVTFKQCLIFAGSQSRADSYRNYLEKDGWPCELISGAQDQKTRLENFSKFRSFKTRILLATDLMARGVDSEHVNLVINLELPCNVVTYLHRIGRAGRFGSHGLAISFLASEKDHNTFKQFITELGVGMKVLKFPLKDQKTKNEPRDLLKAGEFEEDIKYFGVYQSDDQKLLAPLASEDNTTLTSLSDNKENVTNNISSNLQSSIDTNTFLINSQDSALQAPNLSSEQLEVQHNVLTPNLNDSNNDLPPGPNPSENLNTLDGSHNSSSHQLLTSNTIDDASSIAADSLRSSKQDISRYQSVLMQKSAIPTLVEFLVDRHSSQDSQTKENGEMCTKIDLFDAYTKEVLNNNESLTEPVISTDESLLSPNKLALLKSLLIDKPQEKSPVNDTNDLFSDFANFQEDDISTSVSEDIDKQTFILSVATPSLQQDSYSELQNNSSDLYPANGTNTSIETARVEKEEKHFPSPSHNQVSVLPDANRGQQSDIKTEQQHQKLQMLIRKTAQIEIPPYQPPINPPSSESSKESASSPQQEILDYSGSDVLNIERTSSGFNEDSSTTGSSGIESSECGRLKSSEFLDMPIPQIISSEIDDEDYEEEDVMDEDYEEEEDVMDEDYEEKVVIAEDYEEDNVMDEDYEEEMILEDYEDEEEVQGELDEDYPVEDLLEDYEEEEDNDESESEHYFNTDEESESDEEYYDTNGDEEYFDIIEDEDEEISESTTRNHCSNSSNIAPNGSIDSLSFANQVAFSRWLNLYRYQMQSIEDYVRFSNFTKQQQQNE